MYIYFCNFCLEGELDFLFINKGGWSFVFKFIYFDEVEVYGR